METTTTITYRAVIVHNDGEFGYTFNAERETAEEAWADADRLAGLAEGWNLNHKVDFVVQETDVSVTIIDPLNRTEVILTGLVKR